MHIPVIKKFSVLSKTPITAHLLAIVLLTLAPPVVRTAVAQDDEKVLEEVRVTGTQMRGVEDVVGSEVARMTREDMGEVPAVSAFDLGQTLPQFVAQGVTDTQRVGADGQNQSYASAFNIHGLGAYSTLTLFNGRRFVQSNVVGGISDPNSIPTIALQRIEVVADGASAIYGSDAVAGVVNLITRRRFDGADSQLRYGLGDEYHNYNVGVIGGHSWSDGGGNVTAAFEYSGHSDLNGVDRDFYRRDLTAKGGGDYRVNQCYPGNIIVGGVTYPQPGLEPGAPNLCDNDKVADLIPSQERTSFMLSLSQDVGSQVTLTFDGYYSDRSFRSDTAWTGGNLTLPPTNPYYMAPPGVSGPVTVAYSFGDQNANPRIGGAEMYQYVGAIDWRLPGDWQIDASYSYGRETSYGDQYYNVNSGALAAALRSSDPATALNPFTDNNSQSVLDSIFNGLFHVPGKNKSQQGLITASGPLFELPGGSLRLAVGAEYIRDEYAGGVSVGTVANPIDITVDGSRNIKSVFGEVLVPIFGADNAIPGFQRLELSLAGRISDYSDVGRSENPKVGVTWEPLEGFALKGTYGTSFRAPNLAQIHTPSSALYVLPYATPQGVVTGVSLSGFREGNPLKPEEADTWTVGFDWTPPSVPGLQVSLTYFNVEYTDQISRLFTDTTILQSPEKAAQYADRIVTGPEAAALIQSFLDQNYPVRGVMPSPLPMLFIYGQQFNSAISKVNGIDFRLSYSFSDFTVGIMGTRYTRWDTAVSPTAPLIDELNTLYLPPKFRSRARFAWDPSDNIDVAVFLNYTGSYKNPRSTRVETVSSDTTVDFHLAYTWADLRLPLVNDVTLSFDGTNIFDEDPPFVDVATGTAIAGGYDGTIGNPIGRVLSLTLSTRF